MHISKFTNNMRYLYRKSDCSSWNEFANKYGLSYKVLDKWLNREDEPPLKSLQQMSEKLGVNVEYLQQKRKELTLYELDYWHHPNEHRNKKYTLDDFYDALGKVAEDINFDREAFEYHLKESHH